jgi:hypothetical protein
VPRAIIFSVSGASAGCDGEACTLPAFTKPRTATSGTVWFSTTSTTRPLPSTLRTVRAANGSDAVATAAAAGREAARSAAGFVVAATRAAATAGAFACVAVAREVAAADEVAAAGAAGTAAVRTLAVGTNQPTVARSGTRYVAATRCTSAAVMARMRST